MCKAKKYAEQLLEIYENINNDVLNLDKDRKELEGTELDILHIIENENFNVVQGYKLAKMIKDIRVERRNIKIEQDTILNLKRNFVDKNMNTLKATYGQIKKQDELLQNLKEKKIYKPRVLESTNLKLVIAN